VVNLQIKIRKLILKSINSFPARSDKKTSGRKKRAETSATKTAGPKGMPLAQVAGQLSRGPLTGKKSYYEKHKQNLYSSYFD
jgi:hypothetical protein